VREKRSLRAGLGVILLGVTEVAKYPCPCCGYLVFGDLPGSYDTCPICFWEDDLVQLRWPQLGDGANAVPLVEAQQNFLKLGAMEQRFVKNVRAVGPDDKREPGWRHIDTTDVLEPEASRIPWPEELTTLYYWRPTFWRRSTTEPQPVAPPPSRVDGYGKCESCESSFPYYLIHNGFNDSTYAYCDHCGRLAVLNLAELEKRIGPLPPLVVPISEEGEASLKPCPCNGRFRGQAAPRCPSCGAALSAEKAAEWLERNAPGTKGGWKWQRSWAGLYAVAISDRVVFEPWMRRYG
jgi:hypothetical protein